MAKYKSRLTYRIMSRLSEFLAGQVLFVVFSLSVGLLFVVCVRRVCVVL
jgi:hypothetical protein